MKKLTSYVLTLLLLSSSAVSAGAYSADVQVQINGEIQHFDQPAVIYNNFTLVPLRGIFEKLGAEVKWDDTARKITATKDDVTVTLVIGQKTGFVNSKPVPLDVSARIMEGRTMVPLRFISESFRSEVEWNGETKQVLITTEDIEVPDSDSDETTSDQKPSSTKGISYDEAISLALDHSNELKNAKIDIEQADKSLEGASDFIEYIPAAGGNKAASQAFTGWNKAQTAYFMAQKQFEIKEETLEFEVKSTYNDILVNEKEKKVAKTNVENIEMKKHIAHVKAENGMASQFDVTQADLALEEEQAKYEAISQELGDAYTKLNRLLGKKSDERYALASHPTFEKMEDVDLDTTVSQVVTGSSAVWLAEQQVHLAKLDVKYFTFSGTFTDKVEYEQAKLEESQAKVSASGTKEQIEAAVRSVYYNIKQLEQQHDVLQVNVAKAKEGMNLTQVRYDIGMATAEDIFESKVALEQLEEQILNLTAQHDNLKNALKKPWVIGTN